MNTDTKLDAMLNAAHTRDWPGPARNTHIEEFIMNQAAKQDRSGRARRAGVLFGIGGLLLAGAVYGANRLYEQYSVKLNVNGVETQRTVEAGPDGTAMMEVQMPGGGTARVLVGKENIGEDGQIHVGLTVVGGEGEATATVSADGSAQAEGAVESDPAPKH